VVVLFCIELNLFYKIDWTELSLKWKLYMFRKVDRRLRVKFEVSSLEKIEDSI